MYNLLIRNYTQYIPSKNKTWLYKKGYYQIPSIRNRMKKSYISDNLSPSIKKYYYTKYKYRVF